MIENVEGKHSLRHGSVISYEDALDVANLERELAEAQQQIEQLHVEIDGLMYDKLAREIKDAS
jgi:hypothetical protein